MRIEDISPTGKNTTVKVPAQATGGRALTVAGSPDGKRLYVGNNAGVWRSKDGGLSWSHMERGQPRPGTFDVPGALLALNVYDLAVAKNPDVVLACTNFDLRTVNPRDGIWRSTDAGASWKLVRPSARTGQIVAAPENANVLFAACGNALVRSDDAGATWKNLTLPIGGAQVFQVAVGPAGASGESTRRIYALSNGQFLWTSPDGGGTWSLDNTGPLVGFPPGDAAFRSARLLAIHPKNPKVVYGIAFEQNTGRVRVARGDFSAATPAWTFLTDLPPPTAETTPSGTEYVTAHVTNEGTLYLFVSNRSASYVSIGDAPAAWARRLDDVNAVGLPLGLLHIDPHAVFLSKDFRLASDGGARGLVAQVNDGGVQISTDGAGSWTRTNGYTTFSLINVAVNPVKGTPPKITFGTGDNGGFFSGDGGANWISGEYQQGDNDACFSDPLQPSLLFVFAPRTDKRELVLYTGAGGKAPNAGFGTSDARYCPSPKRNPDGTRGWNCVSDSVEIGYRPLILTLPGQTPMPGGDFITIRIPPAPAARRLLRTTNMPAVMDQAAWDSTVTTADKDHPVFQQGPDLPPGDVRIAQASGGHANPTYFVGDKHLMWRLTSGAWQQVAPDFTGPGRALRFYVDPYRPNRFFVLDDEKVWRSNDGGKNWTHDTNLEAALTDGGTMIKVAPNDVQNPGDPLMTGRTPFEAQLQDVAFDPNDEKVMFAAGPAGIFMTSDGGATWSVLASAAALNTRVMSLFLDVYSDPKTRILYVATPFRGLLKITVTPPGLAGTLGLAIDVARVLLFPVFRTAPLADPFVASVDPVNPDTTKPEGKLQKALTDAIKAKASDPAHNQILKARDPTAADFASIFPIPFTIAEVTTSGAKFPVADYNGDEVDFIASAFKPAVLFAALELRAMVRRFVQDFGIGHAADLLAALPLLDPTIQSAVQLIKEGKDVLGRAVPIKDAQRIPDYARIFEFQETAGGLQVNFKGDVAPETTGKKKPDYDFGHSLYDMVVNSGDETARNCIDAMGYAFMNGALEAAGFFVRPPAADPTKPRDPKTFRGLWIGGNYAFATIRGVMSVNDGPAQFGGTTRQLARLFALIRSGTFADVNDPSGDLSWFLLNKAADPGAAFPPTFQSYADRKYTYVLNKLGWAPLGRGDPSATWVASEVSLIKTQKVGHPDRLYVVAWTNDEVVRARGGGSISAVKRGGRTLYMPQDVLEIINATLAAYEA